MIKIDADAKINLGLDILGKRDDGYHDVYMIMQALEYGDTVVLEKRPGGGVTFETNDPDIPTDDTNLAVRAANEFSSEFNSEFSDEFASWDFGVHIKLKKRIPSKAGLGGGSADAAAVIKGMNLLFNTGLSRETLMKIGARVGSDVPFCIIGKTALAKGRGEHITPLHDLPQCKVLIVKPADVEISTKEAYDSMDGANDIEHPDIDGLAAALRQREPLDKICALFGNSFEKVMTERYPVIGEIKDCLEKEGAVKAMMSGSGPAVFGVFEDEDTFAQAQTAVKSAFPGAVVIATSAR